MEVKRVSSLSSQYGFSEEYIAMLMYHLSEKSVLTVNRLINKAIKLADDNINTVEDLERYLEKAERENGEFNEIRRVLGIYDRFLSVSEEKYFRKWLYEYSFGAVVIALAYDYCVLNKGKKDLRYMESLMKDWHDAGCKTEADCRDRYEQRRAEQDKAASEKRAAEKKNYSKPEREKPRYGNFDAEEAFRLALARSFPGDENDEEGK
jgi:DnaD/phage-associated family protein